jgi:hypothetical protein
MALDCSIRIRRGLARRNQRHTDPGIQPHLVIDRASILLKLIGMGLLRLAVVLANEAVMQLDRFVREARTRLDQEGDQGGVAALGTEPLQELGRVARALTRETNKARLVDLAGDIGVEPDGSDRLQPFGQRHEGGRRRPSGWLAQCRQGGPPRAWRHNQQSVQLRSLDVRQGGGQLDEP